MGSKTVQCTQASCSYLWLHINVYTLSINIYTLSKWGPQTSTSSEVNQKEKKIFVMARGKDVNFSKASQPVKMSMNFFTREWREGAVQCQHTHEEQLQFWWTEILHRRAQTQPLPNLKWPPSNRDYITLPHEESKVKLIWFSQAAARRDISVLPAQAGTPHRAVPSQWTGTHWPAWKQSQHKKGIKPAQVQVGAAPHVAAQAPLLGEEHWLLQQPTLVPAKRRKCISKGDFKSF